MDNRNLKHQRKLFLVNGFLGAGKTTLITRAASILQQQGTRVAVITNDQGNQLVDTRFIGSQKIPVEEVRNGCFCCKYPDLLQAVHNLDEAFNTSLYFAESVGSCTDLVATIVKPIEAAGIRIQPVITILADATMLPSMFNASMLFDKKVVYIFQKQLDEADIILVTKTDLLPSDRTEKLMEQVRERFPGKPCIMLALHKNDDERATEGVKEWLDFLQHFSPVERTSLMIDYDTYAGGEAALAWYDQQVEIASESNNAVALAHQLVNEIFAAIRKQNLEIGHLKFYLHHEKQPVKISFTTSSDGSYPAPSISEESGRQTVLINARVQTTPRLLENIIGDTIVQFQIRNHCSVKTGNARSFQPGYPTPIHRIQ